MGLGVIESLYPLVETLLIQELTTKLSLHDSTDGSTILLVIFGGIAAVVVVFAVVSVIHGIKITHIYSLVNPPRP